MCESRQSTPVWSPLIGLIVIYKLKCSNNTVNTTNGLGEIGSDILATRSIPKANYIK